jgi:hypothetical protein
LHFYQCWPPKQAVLAAPDSDARIAHRTRAAIRHARKHSFIPKKAEELKNAFETFEELKRKKLAQVGEIPSRPERLPFQERVGEEVESA